MSETGIIVPFLTPSRVEPIRLQIQIDRTSTQKARKMLALIGTSMELALRTLDRAGDDTVAGMEAVEQVLDALGSLLAR